MTLYDTIPTNTEDETFLKQSKTPMKRIAGAAATAFILGCVAATAQSRTYTPKQTSLATSCDTTSQATCLTIYGCQWFNDNGDVSGDVGGCRNWGDNFGQLSWWCGLAKDETSCTGQSVTFGNKNAYMTGTCSWDGSQCVVNKKWCPPMAKSATCENDCTAASVTCELACAAEVFSEPECGIACGVVEAFCTDGCPPPPWLKDSAAQNILLISVTLDTFQLLSGWLKDTAPSSSNIRYILVTLDTSQFLISPYFVTTRCFLAPPFR